MSKTASKPLEQLKKLLSQTKSDICKQWADIKTNDDEISYKKANIDQQFELFSAKKAIARGSDKNLSKWVVGYEIHHTTSNEFKKKLRETFTPEESEEFKKLGVGVKHKLTKDQGYTFTHEQGAIPISLEQIAKYNAYQIKLEKAQFYIWESPYELLSEHCSTHSHVEL